jgi:hypothetical protein
MAFAWYWFASVGTWLCKMYLTGIKSSFGESRVGKRLGISRKSVDSAKFCYKSKLYLKSLQKMELAGHWWLMPIILGT